MSETFHDLAAAAKRVQRSRRTIDRWIEAGELHVVLGRVRESELLATERRMRGRRGRPRKNSASSAEPTAVVAEALGSENDAAAVVAALVNAGLLHAEKCDKRVAGR